MEFTDDERALLLRGLFELRVSRAAFDGDPEADRIAFARIRVDEIDILFAGSVAIWLLCSSGRLSTVDRPLHSGQYACVGATARAGDAVNNSISDDQTALVREYYDGAARSVRLLDGRLRSCHARRGPEPNVFACSRSDLGSRHRDGRESPFLPADVKLTGVDLSPAMLAFAERRAQHLDLEIDLEVGDAEGLDFPDAHFETVTATLLMSTVPNPQRAAEEMRRVLRSGGRLLILDFAVARSLPCGGSSKHSHR